MEKRKLTFFFIEIMLSVCLLAYAILEIAVRKFRLPDPNLIRDIEMKLASTDSNLQNFYASNRPIYGWDQEVISLVPTGYNPQQNDQLFTILFSGDSVTRGKRVDIHKESYPILLFEMLNQLKNVHVLNAAVDGFGVDQMVLKLNEIVPHYQPDLIVFAYIPHDLWRPARNFNYGITKPVFIADNLGNWKIHPSPNISQFYEDYSNAKNRYYLSLWSLSHVASNLRYYFPKLYSSYYRGLFEEIRNRLITLAEKNNAEILLVRLASMWPGKWVSFLDKIALEIFAEPSDFEDYHFFDSEDCVRTESAALGIEYEKEFKTHPRTIGHEILRGCLLNPIRVLSVGQ